MFHSLHLLACHPAITPEPRRRLSIAVAVSVEYRQAAEEKQSLGIQCEDMVDKRLADPLFPAIMMIKVTKIYAVVGSLQRAVQSIQSRLGVIRSLPPRIAQNSF